MLTLSLATLAGGLWLMAESMGVLLAYAPMTMPVAPAKRLAEARERLARDGTEYNRWVSLADVAFWRVDTNDLARAVAEADEALAMAPRYRNDWNYGNVIHKANLARGRVALRLGRTQAATVFLLAAGRTPGSPQLDSFGPNMLLAKELLEAGETAAVLEHRPLRPLLDDGPRGPLGLETHHRERRGAEFRGAPAVVRRAIGHP